jgi:pectate lyase
MIDHVSIGHALDEAVQVSWASQGTISRSVIAETVDEHADRGGMLLNYSHPEHPQDQLSIVKNLWYRIGGRVPEITCEASAYDGDPGSAADCQTRPLHLEVANNDYFDPGFLLWYNRDVDQNGALGPYRLRLNLVNNTMQVRATFPYGFALHDLLDVSQNQLFVSGNTLSRHPAFADYQLFYCCNDFATEAPNTNLGVATRLSTRHPHPAVDYVPTASLRANLLADVGARPRDPMDRRIAASVNSGSIPALSHEVPVANDSFDLDFDPLGPPAAPADSDNDGMPNAFEIQHGTHPNVADHNGTQLSQPLLGIAGYTNLEVYLHLLADGATVAPETPLFLNGFE